MLNPTSNEPPLAMHPFRDKAAAILRRAPPKAYAALQFSWRAILHVWRRRVAIVAVALPLLAAAAVVSLHPQLEQWRPLLLLTLALAGFVIAGAYLAFRVYLLAERVHFLAGRVHGTTSDADVRRLVAGELVTFGAKLTERLEQRIQSALGSVGGVREEFSASAWEVSALKEEVASFYGRCNALATALGTLTQEMSALAQRCNALDLLNKKVATLQASVNDMDKRCETFAPTQEIAALRQEITALAGRCDALASTEQLRSSVATLQMRIGDLDKRCGDVLGSTEQLSSSVATLQASISGLDKRCEGFVGADALEGVRNQLTRTNAHFFQRFNRNLTQAHIGEFKAKWSKALSVTASDHVVGYVAHRACQIEQLLHGRIATSAEDITLRTLVALSVKKSNVNILEIGTLFGVGAAILFDALIPARQSVHLTLLDPLDGYYQGGQRDILTGQPVNEKLLRANFAKIGMTDSDFDLIKRMSTDPEAISAAAIRRYDVLVIDGDHSYAGVKTDFENYARFVSLGGYVVFDDYGADDWPDVARFVDDEMPRQSRFARVGASWRTCVYRAVTPPPDDVAAAR